MIYFQLNDAGSKLARSVEAGERFGAENGLLSSISAGAIMNLFAGKPVRLATEKEPRIVQVSSIGMDVRHCGGRCKHG